LTKEALIRHLNTLLVIIWLLRDASDIAFDRLSTHLVDNFFGLLRRIIHDVNTFNQMFNGTANLSLMNEGIEILLKEGDPDVRRIPTCMNMASVKIRKAQMDQPDSSWFTARTEDPRAACACEHVGIARTLTETTDWNSVSFSVIFTNWLRSSVQAIWRTKGLAPSLRLPGHE
jgi:hypothetical protein